MGGTTSLFGGRGRGVVVVCVWRSITRAEADDVGLGASLAQQDPSTTNQQRRQRRRGGGAPHGQQSTRGQGSRTGCLRLRLLHKDAVARLCITGAVLFSPHCVLKHPGAPATAAEQIPTSIAARFPPLLPLRFIHRQTNQRLSSKNIRSHSKPCV